MGMKGGFHAVAEIGKTVKRRGQALAIEQERRETPAA